ncbi:DoxX family protein [Rhodococcus sp. RS1C4]|uniref:DoxX family protein n=1 Tax=Nocardiaceae TaxID=85025 RepID=UPI0003786729|nr:MULTISPECIES: DoxX family protein [Rhodococcus]OZC52151.1 DoxX family protein [Rhodococcus sp. 06-621-2]OZC55042.1 DoxX family protein [Rhodococcus sp. RS1C4]OZC74381.1 DoxX family protein [Rhodococcus sp. 06-418-1B]OZD10044.1 DoxX family protein [Rhodococcus sp. 06-156-4C]OZD21952.1 DoxX family protein [Rhodococcus sp. 06-156-3C]
MASNNTQTENVTPTVPSGSRTAARAGWVLTALLAIFLIFDGVTKLINVQQVRDATVDLGLREEMTPVIGVVLLVSLALFLVPRTAFLGAVLLTGYLGGAVLTNWRVDKPLFSTVLFAVYVGVAVWAALYLRDPKVRQVMPFVR